MNKEFVTIVGVVRNVEKQIEKSLERILLAFKDFEVEKIIIVESDSTDQTLRELDKLQKIHDNFIYISKGELSKNIPNRIERIRFCRNIYVEEIRTRVSKSSYIVVADLDGINSQIKSKYVRKCFVDLEWDAIFPNQLFGYYDILALRHEYWSNVDCMEELEWRQKIIPISDGPNSIRRRFYNFLEYDRAREIAIYSKMIRLDTHLPRILVQSAFGGLGIYKKDVFMRFNYSSSKQLSNCEHLDLHSKMNQANMKLYIEPGFINNYVNTYNINKIRIIRLLRKFIWNSSALYSLQRKIQAIGNR